MRLKGLNNSTVELAVNLKASISRLDKIRKFWEILHGAFSDPWLQGHDVMSLVCRFKVLRSNVMLSYLILYMF